MTESDFLCQQSSFSIIDNSLGAHSLLKLFLIHTFNFWQSVTHLTGKSLLEALFLASTNPQYEKRLVIGLPVQYMKTTSAEHVGT